MTDDALRGALLELGVGWRVTEHDPVFTVEESEALHAAMPGLHTKSLFLKDAASRFWLVTVPAHARVDLKALSVAVGAKRVSFGKADDMVRLLGVTPGAVTPLAARNDSGGEVGVVLDRAVAKAAIANVHPLRNTATLALSGTDLIRVLERWRHAPLVIDVPVQG